MAAPKTLIIVPAYNEEQALPATLNDLRTHFSPGDILVVNDGSADGTSAAARRAGVNVIDLPANMGIGVAMQTGYIYAARNGYGSAVQCDADGQHPPAEIGELLERLAAEGADMVIGSRFLDRKKEGFKSLFLRRQAIRFFSWWIWLLTGVRVYDVTSGFRVAGGRAIAIFANDYPFDYPEPEAIVLLTRHGCRIGETPVSMRDRQGGVSSIGPLAAVYYMVKVSIGILVTRLRRV